VKEIFPDAEVTAEIHQTGYPDEVHVCTADGTVLVKVEQRNLYRKYNWPAKKPIQEALTAFKQA
jgi:hypothetical protein